MDLNKLYSLRKDFTVIGLTGRTGSGCSRIAELLSGPFTTLEAKGLRAESEFTDEVFKRKYSICKNFIGHNDNWVPFEIIRYVDVLLFYILHKHGGNLKDLSNLLTNFYKENLSENNQNLVAKIKKDVIDIDSKYTSLIKKIKAIPPFTEIKSDDELKELGALFFNKDFNNLKEELFACLESNEGYYRNRCMLHWVSCNLRRCGDAIGKGLDDISNIFSIANLINRLIKAKRVINDNKPTKIVIDSLRNSLEIMFFKERYSAFYMVATKDVIGNTKKRIDKRLFTKIADKNLREKVINQIIELDEIEYRTKDFSKGTFSSPDVENCIQKSDYHIFNLKVDGLKNFVDDHFEGNSNGFFTREEQLMKLVSLIQQLS
ncbi:MAG: hypothetical protein IPP48_10180 [Chitinophagaceae bacterium]|nr:hypothetical protein [Chitinophagaceae bacterium]